MREALFYDKLGNQKTRCTLCNHQCVIEDKKRGLCGVRENRGGKLYSLVYGRVVAENVDPIEKKPIYNFLPGTNSLSIAAVGCNFRCLNCQNCEISQISKDGAVDIEKLGKILKPKEVIQHAISHNCPSISYTYTEPTIFLEFALDCMKLAHSHGLKNIWVSNGYMSKEALDLIAPFLDAINVDLKAFTQDFYNDICGARLQPVLENLKDIKGRNIHLEITTLIIPNKNDSEEEISKIAEFIKNELGEDTPWHILGFFPCYKMNDVLPTPREKIIQAVETGKKKGLKYVYSGNI